MMESLSQLHLLRPWGLVFVLIGLVLPYLWRRMRQHQDALHQMIAPHLLPHLTVKHSRTQRLKPVHITSLLLVVAGLAVAGPSWDKALPDFDKEQTRVSILIDLSASMGSDRSNTLALVQDRIYHLAERNPGWHLNLIGYGESAHLIVPFSRDRELLSLYLNSLEAGMTPGTGRNLSTALALARQLTVDKSLPTSLILLTDNLEIAELSNNPDPSPVPPGIRVLTTASTLAAPGTRQTLDTLSAKAQPFTTRENDLRWLEQQVKAQFTHQQNTDDTLQWQDRGYWLIWPALLLVLLGMRRGWRVHVLWLPVLLCLSTPQPVLAGPLADAFLTPDQQGRLAFESGRYYQASRHFESPYLKGLSAYRAADYTRAIRYFSQLESARAWFYLGNSYAKQLELHKAITAYQAALDKQPDFPQATANLELVTRMAASLDKERQQAPEMESDELRFDNEAEQGTQAEIQMSTRMTDAVWLENLNTSATDFLRRRFTAEQHAQRSSADAP